MSIKFLLTSSGITNKSIQKALLELAKGNFSDKKWLFIPTAQNPKTTDKSRFIQHINNFAWLGFQSIDMVDIAIEDLSIIEEKILKSDIIFFWWGNALYLKTKLFKLGFLQNFQKIFENKVIVGISAGSIVWWKSFKEEKDMKKLEEIWVNDFYIGEEYNLFDHIFIPHFGRAEYPQYSRENLEKIAPSVDKTMYCLDDDSALLTDGEKREIISEGYYKIYN